VGRVEGSPRGEGAGPSRVIPTNTYDDNDSPESGTEGEHTATEPTSPVTQVDEETQTDGEDRTDGEARSDGEERSDKEPDISSSDNDSDPVNDQSPHTKRTEVQARRVRKGRPSVRKDDQAFPGPRRQPLPTPGVHRLEAISSAVASIIGQQKLDDIFQGSTVEVALPWLMEPVTNVCDIVMWQVEMYRSRGDMEEIVWTALQQALRQDLLLWMLATLFLGQGCELVALPLPTPLELLPTKPLSSIRATISQGEILVGDLNLTWTPKKSLTDIDNMTVALGNAQGKYVTRNENTGGRIRLGKEYTDKRAAIFSHSHPISRALAGFIEWDNPLVELAVNDLLNPNATAGIVHAHSNMLRALMVESAMCSLRVDATLDRQNSFLMNSRFAHNAASIPLQAAYHGVGITTGAAEVTQRDYSIAENSVASDIDSAIEPNRPCPGTHWMLLHDAAADRLTTTEGTQTPGPQEHEHSGDPGTDDVPAVHSAAKRPFVVLDGIEATPPKRQKRE
jgi:hypothetical protein